MKVCSKCGIEKELSNFSKYKYSKDGYKPACKYCLNLENKKYYTNKKINIKRRNAKRYKIDKDKHSIRNKIYRDNHKKEITLRMLKYNKENTLKNKIKFKKWYQKNYEKVKYIKEKRRAIKLQCTPPWIDSQKKEIEALYKKASELTKETGIKHHIDHIYPLVPIKTTDPVGLHVLANLQILTAEENLHKSNLQPEEWEKRKASLFN